MKIGILALQGAVVPHEEKLRALGVEVVHVRRPEHLQDLAGIILPGGESTTMLHLLRLNGLWEPLKQFVKIKPSWGVCAGSILLANHVTSPTQDSFAAIEMTVERNAFGRQSESFIAPLDSTCDWTSEPLPEGVFIRAPRIRDLGSNVKTLLRWKTEPVMVRQGKTLASTFHPELTDSLTIHKYFTTLCES